MWDLPRPGLEPVSPALAGRFSTTAPPGKPQVFLFNPQDTKGQIAPSPPHTLLGNGLLFPVLPCWVIFLEKFSGSEGFIILPFPGHFSHKIDPVYLLALLPESVETVTQVGWNLPSVSPCWFFGKKDPVSPFLNCSISFCQPEISICGSNQYVNKFIQSANPG